MIYLVSISNTGVNTSPIDENQIVFSIITRTMVTTINTCMFAVFSMPKVKHGLLKTDGSFYSLGTGGCEMYVVEADSPALATEKALQTFKLPKKECA